MTAFVDAYGHPDTAKFLWQLMQESMDEPHTTIAHKEMPTWEGHLAWLARRGYAQLSLIIDYMPYRQDDLLIGYVGVTDHNEIGIRIRKGFRGKGYGKEAINYVLEHLTPRPGVPSVAPGKFIAHINPANTPSIALFTGLGAKPLEYTYVFDHP